MGESPWSIDHQDVVINMYVYQTRRGGCGSDGKQTTHQTRITAGWGVIMQSFMGCEVLIGKHLDIGGLDLLVLLLHKN